MARYASSPWTATRGDEDAIGARVAAQLDLAVHVLDERRADPGLDQLVWVVHGDHDRERARLRIEHAPHASEARIPGGREIAGAHADDGLELELVEDLACQDLRHQLGAGRDVRDQVAHGGNRHVRADLDLVDAVDLGQRLSDGDVLRDLEVGARDAAS